MAVSGGGSLLGSEVRPAYQGELEKWGPLALLLLSISHFSVAWLFKQTQEGEKTCLHPGVPRSEQLSLLLAVK